MLEKYYGIQATCGGKSRLDQVKSGELTRDFYYQNLNQGYQFKRVVWKYEPS